MDEFLTKAKTEGAKNAQYLNHHSYRDLLEVMSEYVEKPMLEAASSQPFTIFIDETTAVGNKSMACVYLMFDDGQEVREHYLRIINMNPGLGLTARHYYNATLELCRKKGISLENCAFSEMDGCSTMQGSIKGLKQFFSFHNAHHVSESCGSHKLARLTQKIVVDGRFEPLMEADKLAVGLAAFLNASSLRAAVFENTQKILQNRVLKLISPSAVRWLSHGKCFDRLIEVILPTLVTLNSLFTDKEDYKALGFLLGMIQPSFLLSCLALHDVFRLLGLLSHWLQTSPGDADITRVPVLVKKTSEKLLYLAGDNTKKDSMTKEEVKAMKFTLVKFEELSTHVDQFVMSTPVAASSRRRRDASHSSDKKAVFEDFQDEIVKPFAKDMAENIEQSLRIDPVCRAFACLDIRTFPKSDDLENYGEEDLETLINWYGVARLGMFPAVEEEKTFFVDPKVNFDETRLEYKTFKEVVKLELIRFEKEKKVSLNEYERKISQIRNNRNQGRDKRKVKTLEKQINCLKKKELTLSDIYRMLLKPDTGSIMPNIKKLVLLATLSPVGNAVVERLFSLMKIMKTLLRNRLSDQSLDLQLRLNKEAPGTWTDDQKEDLVDMWIKRRESGGNVFRLKL